MLIVAVVLLSLWRFARHASSDSLCGVVVSAKSYHEAVSSSPSALTRRIQHEWKDAIRSGIAFDWSTGQPVKCTTRKKGNKVFVKDKDESNDAKEFTDEGMGSKSKSRPKPQHIWIGPFRRNILEWHFTITGLPGSVYEGGLYHGRIILPRDYPASPPSVQLMTPTGRFVPFKSICLSASRYHPETWQPNMYSIRTLVESLRLHMITFPNEIGGINDSYEQRLEYARQSRHWAWNVINHGTMIKQGLIAGPAFQEPDPIEDSDDLDDGLQQLLDEVILDNNDDIEMLDGENDRVVIRYEPKAATRNDFDVARTLFETLLATLCSPVRMGLLGFLVLFYVLNFVHDS